MLPLLVPLPSARAVGVSQTAIFDLPTDRRYRTICIQYKTNANQATIEAAISRVRLKVNGNVVRTFTPAQLIAKNAEKGIAFSAGFLEIRFVEYENRIASERDLYAWGMADVSTFQIEVDITGAASAPALAGFAEVDNVREPFDGIVSWRTFVIDVTATGDKDFTIPVREKFEVVKSISLFETTNADINSVTIMTDNYTVFDMDVARVTKYLASRRITKQSAVFPINFDANGTIDEFLPLVKADGSRVSDFRITANMAVAANFTALVETFGRPAI